ncbi:MAG: hypothetical protein ACI4XK_04740 [Bacilli bacterium]
MCNIDTIQEILENAGKVNVVLNGEIGVVYFSLLKSLDNLKILYKSGAVRDLSDEYLTKIIINHIKIVMLYNKKKDMALGTKTTGEEFTKYLISGDMVIDLTPNKSLSNEESTDKKLTRKVKFTRDRNITNFNPDEH